MEEYFRKIADYPLASVFSMLEITTVICLFFDEKTIYLSRLLIDSYFLNTRESSSHLIVKRSPMKMHRPTILRTLLQSSRWILQKNLSYYNKVNITKEYSEYRLYLSTITGHRVFTVLSCCWWMILPIKIKITLIK